MSEENLKTRIEELENKLNEQEDEITRLKKKTRKHKWLIFSLLCDNK